MYQNSTLSCKNNPSNISMRIVIDTAKEVDTAILNGLIEQSWRVKPYKI